MTEEQPVIITKELEGSLEESTQPERVTLLVKDSQDSLTIVPLDLNNPKDLAQRLTEDEPKLTAPYQGPKASNTKFYLIEGVVECWDCLACSIKAAGASSCGGHGCAGNSGEVTVKPQEFTKFHFSAEGSSCSISLSQLLADRHMSQGWHPKDNTLDLHLLMLTTDQDKNTVRQAWSSLHNIKVTSEMNTDTMAIEEQISMVSDNYWSWKRVLNKQDI